MPRGRRVLRVEGNVGNRLQVLAGGRKLFDDNPVAGYHEAARAIRDWQDSRIRLGPMRRALAERMLRMGLPK